MWPIQLHLASSVTNDTKLEFLFFFIHSVMQEQNKIACTVDDFQAQRYLSDFQFFFESD